MKTSVHEILGGAAPEELGPIDGLGAAPLPADTAGRIRELALDRAGLQKKRKRHFSRYMMVAVLAVVLAAALVGCYVADEAQYARAAEFFDLNDFSTEGLSRSEIKRVWRDITTESMSYDKSYEVLSQNSSTVTLPGVDISIRNYANNANISPDSASYSVRFDRYITAPDNGVYYELNWDVDDDGGYIGAYLIKYTDGERVWRADFTNAFSLEGYLETGGIVYVYGEKTDYRHSYDDEGRAAAVDAESGRVLWEKSLPSLTRAPEGKAVAEAVTYEYIRAAAPAADGSVALFGGDYMSGSNHMFFRVLSPDGDIVTEKTIQIKDFNAVWRAVALVDGYLLEISVRDAEALFGYKTKLMVLSPDGEVTREFSYGTEEYTYDITDMAVHGGRVFVSATARPTDSKLYSDLTAEDYGTDSEHPFGKTTESWRERARAEFSAVLFVFDPSSGDPEQFYNVGGAFAGALGEDSDGSLTWDAERILTCGYSPATNSFSIYGSTRRYVYTFDSARGQLAQERTDLIGSYATH